MLLHGLTNQGTWGELPAQSADETADGVFAIELVTPKFSDMPPKFRGTLRIVLTRMTDEPAVM